MITPEQLDDLPLTRKEAKFFGSKFYFTNKSCKRGHLAKRFTGCGSCIKCKPLDKANYRKTNKFKQSNKQYYKNNKDKILDRQLLNRYKLTRDQYKELLKAQNYVCAICNGIEKRLPIGLTHTPTRC